MSIEKKELIAKLQDIQARYNKVKSIRSKIKRFEPEDQYSREVVVPAFPGESEFEQHEQWKNELTHEDKNAVEVIEGYYRGLHTPVKPQEPEIKPFEKYRENFFSWEYTGCLFYLSLFVGIIGFFAGLAAEDSVSKLVSRVIFLLGAAGLGFYVIRNGIQIYMHIADNVESRRSHRLDAERKERKYAAELDDYNNKMSTFENEVKKFVEDYKAWREIYIARQEEARIEKQLEADKKAGISRIHKEELAPAEAAMNEINDLVSEEYLPVLDDLIDLLKSGRADDLKEALNLYEEIAYRERELELQRRAELERTEAEERRHRQEMRAMEEQEGMRRREEDRANSRREREREEAERESWRREREAQERAKREAENRCFHCANRKNCSLKVTRPQNCSAFRP